MSPERTHPSYLDTVALVSGGVLTLRARSDFLLTFPLA